MVEFTDFVRSALPWVAIGLLAACSCAAAKARQEGTETSKFFRGICWLSVVCFLLAAIMEMLEGNQSGGTVWLVLAVFNAVVHYANTQKEEK